MRLYYLHAGSTAESIERKHIDRELARNPAARSQNLELRAPTAFVLARAERLSSLLQRVKPETTVVIDSVAVAGCQFGTLVKILKERESDQVVLVTLEPKLMRLTFANAAFAEFGNLVLLADKGARMGLKGGDAAVPPAIIDRMRRDRARGDSFPEIAVRYGYQVGTVRSHTKDVITTAHAMQLRRQRRAGASVQDPRLDKKRRGPDLSFLQQGTEIHTAVRSALRFIGNAKRSRDVYAANIKYFLRFIASREGGCVITDPAQVTEEMAISYKEDMEEREFSASTIASRLSTLRKFFEHLVGEQTCTKNPFRRVRLPRIRRNHSKFEALSEDEVKCLLEAAWRRVEASPLQENPTKHWRARRDYIIVKLLFSTGVRVSGIIYIKPCELSLDGERPNFQCRVKSDLVYRVPLTDSLTRDLKEYLTAFCKDINPKTEYVFHSDETFLAPMQPATVSQVLNKIAKAAGIERRVTPHAARVTFATHCYKNGMPIPVIQERLNHADITTTQSYIKYAETTKEDWLPGYAVRPTSDYRERPPI